MNKTWTMMKDKNFQKAMLIGLGISLTYAIWVFGIVTVTKWYVAYKALLAIGGVVTMAAWFKITCGVCIGVFTAGTFAVMYSAYKSDMQKSSDGRKGK